MQIDAINSYSQVNFEGRKKSGKVSPKNRPHTKNNTPGNGFMKGVSGPVLAVMMIPLASTALTSCDDQYVTASANAAVYMNGTDGTDETENRDTTSIDFPYDMTDSLYTWIGDYLDIPLDGTDDSTDGSDGSDGSSTGKHLTYLYGERNWDYDRPEYIDLNISKTKGRTDEAYYDHVIADSIKNDIRVTKVASGDITVVKKDGTVTDNVTGLLINEDGTKTFMHSNGKDRIYIYPKATSGEYAGKYVELGYAEHGYLYNADGTEMERYGQNIALYDLLAEGTEDHYIRVNGKMLTTAEIKEQLEEEE